MSLNLSNLSTSGWFVFAWTIASALAFLLRLVRRETDGSNYHAALLGFLIVWTMYLAST